MFDYDNYWYGSNFHNGGIIEANVDKTLEYFSYICYLKKRKVITKHEFKFFLYDVSRILSNSQVQNYLYNLYHFSNKFNKPMSFSYLFEYGRKTKIFDDNFYHVDAHTYSPKYVQHLNF